MEGGLRGNVRDETIGGASPHASETPSAPRGTLALLGGRDLSLFCARTRFMPRADQHLAQNKRAGSRCVRSVQFLLRVADL